MFTESPSVPEPPSAEAPKPPQLPDLPGERQITEEYMAQIEGDADQSLSDALELAEKARLLAALPLGEMATLGRVQNRLNAALDAIEAAEKNNN